MVKLVGALAVNLLAALVIGAAVIFSKALLLLLHVSASDVDTFQLIFILLAAVVLVVITTMTVLSSQVKLEAKSNELSQQEAEQSRKAKELTTQAESIVVERQRLEVSEEQNAARARRLDTLDQNLRQKEAQLDERGYALAALVLGSRSNKQAPPQAWEPAPALDGFCYERLKLEHVEDLENICSKVAATIKAAMAAVAVAGQPDLNGDDSWLRVAIFLPGMVRSPVKEEDRKKRALFVRATTDPESFSHREGRYLLPGQGCAGVAWNEGRTVFGHPPNGQATPNGCGAMAWTDLHDGLDHEHPFRRLCCIPVLDPAAPETVVGVISLDTSLDTFLVDRERADEHIAAATQVACLQLGILIRCCYEADQRSTA
jgi:hypothetical protein